MFDIHRESGRFCVPMTDWFISNNNFGKALNYYDLLNNIKSSSVQKVKMKCSKFT